MKLGGMAMIASSVLLLGACKDDRREELREQAGEVQETAREELREARTDVQAERDEYVREVRGELAKLDEKIKEVEQKAKVDSKADQRMLDERLADLRAGRREVDQALTRLQAESAETWTRARSNVESGLAKLRTAYGGAAAILQIAVYELPEKSDPAIVTKIQSRFAKEEALASSNITIRSKTGVVTLEGRVPSDTAKRRARELARGVEGVTEVKDQLEIQTAAMPKPLNVK